MLKINWNKLLIQLLKQHFRLLIIYLLTFIIKEKEMKKLDYYKMHLDLNFNQ